MELLPGQLGELLMFMVFGATVSVIAFSPLPRALGEALKHRLMHGRTPKAAEQQEGRVDDLSGEVAALRQALYETQERLDFTERMLAQQRERGALGPGPER